MISLIPFPSLALTFSFCFLSLAGSRMSFTQLIYGPGLWLVRSIRNNTIWTCPQCQLQDSVQLMLNSSCLRLSVCFCKAQIEILLKKLSFFYREHLANTCYCVCLHCTWHSCVGWIKANPKYILAPQACIANSLTLLLLTGGVNWIRVQFVCPDAPLRRSTKVPEQV